MKEPCLLVKIIVDKVRWNQNKFLTLHRKTAEVCNYGVMLEWLKRHAWKACSKSREQNRK